MDTEVQGISEKVTWCSTKEADWERQCLELLSVNRASLMAQWVSSGCLVMVTTKELSFKLLEEGEKIPAKPCLWREWTLSSFQETARSPGNLLLKELESCLRAILEEHRGSKFQRVESSKQDKKGPG